MAEMIIMLRRDPNTGKQNIIIKLDSDPDALPHRARADAPRARREAHRQEARGLGEVIIEREPEAQPSQPTSARRTSRRSRRPATKG